MKQNHIAVAIEVKLGKAQKPTKGFYESLKDLKPKHAFVISPVDEAFSLGNGIIMCNLQDFIKTYLPKIIK
jgi:hypothetical protein